MTTSDPAIVPDVSSSASAASGPSQWAISEASPLTDSLRRIESRSRPKLGNLPASLTARRTAARRGSVDRCT